jgi:hypothetical protein
MDDKTLNQLKEMANILIETPLPREHFPMMRELIKMYEDVFNGIDNYSMLFVWLFQYGYIEGKRAERARRKKEGGKQCKNSLTK